MRMETAHQRESVAVVTEPVEDEKGGQCKPHQQVHNASSKVSLVVHKMLLPLLETPLKTHVVFDAEADQAELDLLEQVDRNRPELLEDPKSFIQHLQSLVSRYKAYASGYAQVSTIAPLDSKDDTGT
jgi:hypothetical protein